MVRRDVIPSTRRAHEAAEYARSKGPPTPPTPPTKVRPMHAALLRRYWSEGQDLYAMDTLRGAAVEADLDPDELERAIESGAFRPAVEASIRAASQMGIDAVPTFIFDDRLAVQGAQELPVFRQAMERLGVKPRAP
jgi:predicted DsbA family dithiol-disulfide isomerase